MDRRTVDRTSTDVLDAEILVENGIDPVCESPVDPDQALEHELSSTFADREYFFVNKHDDAHGRARGRSRSVGDRQTGRGSDDRSIPGPPLTIRIQSVLELVVDALAAGMTMNGRGARRGLSSPW